MNQRIIYIWCSLMKVVYIKIRWEWFFRDIIEMHIHKAKQKKALTSARNNPKWNSTWNEWRIWRKNEENETRTTHQYLYWCRKNKAKIKMKTRGKMSINAKAIVAVVWLLHGMWLNICTLGTIFSIVCVLLGGHSFFDVEYHLVSFHVLNGHNFQFVPQISPYVT